MWPYWIMLGLFLYITWLCFNIECDMRRLADVFVDLNRAMQPPSPRWPEDPAAQETPSQQLRLVRAELARVVTRLNVLDPLWPEEED